MNLEEYVSQLLEQNTDVTGVTRSGKSFGVSLPW